MEFASEFSKLIEQLGPFRAQIEEATKLAPTPELREQASSILARMNELHGTTLGEIETANQKYSQLKDSYAEAKKKQPELLAKAKANAIAAKEAKRKKSEARKNRKIAVEIDPQLHARLRREVIDHFRNLGTSPDRGEGIEWQDWISHRESGGDE